MAIRGDLREAGLPDVLQLLGLGQKTGCLSVARPGNFGSIYFERGRIAYATIVNRRDRLGDALIKSGAVDEVDLRAALVEQASDPAARLGDLLLKRGAVMPDALERHVRAQVEEAVLQLFTWTEGTFSFEPEVRADPRDYVVSIDPGSVLLEGARRSDEWQLIATTVPGLDAVFAMTAPVVGPAEERALDAAGFEMSAEARRVVALVDGRRDVARLVEESGLGDFDVARTLHALASAGLARRVGTAPPRETPTRTPRMEEHRNLGVAFYATGLHDEASREFRRVLELAPSDGHARFHLGLIALRAGRWADAAAALGEAATLPGAPAAVFHDLALARARLGQLDDAGEALDEAERRGAATDPRGAVLRAQILRLAGRAAEARLALDRARERGGVVTPSAPWFHLAAVTALADGDPATAVARLEEGVQAHPRSAALLSCLAAARARQGQDDDALRLAERAVAEDQSLAQPMKVVGDVHYRAGRFDLAAAWYARALESAPALGADVWLRLGNVRLRQGDRAGAVDAWREALTLQPDHAIARGNLDALGALGAA